MRKRKKKGGEEGKKQIPPNPKVSNGLGGQKQQLQWRSQEVLTENTNSHDLSKKYSWFLKDLQISPGFSVRKEIAHKQLLRYIYSNI